MRGEWNSRRDVRVRRWQGRAVSVLVAWLALTSGGCGQDPAGSASLDSQIARALESLETELDPLSALAAVESGEPAALAAAREGLASASATDPLWPVQLYLVAEAELRHGDAGTARGRFRELTEWAATDPYGDEFGGSGLATLGLWRWLRLLSTAPAGAETDEERRLVLAAADTLLDSRLVREMFSTQILSSLPQLEEDIRRRLARTAWAVDRSDEALRYFLSYLRISRTGEVDAGEERMRRELVESGQITEESLALFRAERLTALGKAGEAAEQARSVLTSDRPQARAEARILLADLEVRLDAAAAGSQRGRVAKLLETAYEEASSPATAEKALYLHSRVLARPGTGQDLAGQEADLRELRERFPRGQYVDDALLDLARREQAKQDEDAALAYFADLRDHEGPNDYLHTASYQPAMILLTRDAGREMESSYEILSGLKEKEPYGPYQLISTFWMARIAEERGDEKQARRLFQELVDKAPYEFQALRARMHLNLGAAASTRLFPDAETCAELREEFEGSEVEDRIEGRSVYHRRLRSALDSALYRAALDGEIGLRAHRRPPQRLENLSLSDLVGLAELPRIAVLMALRQDALAARDRPPDPDAGGANRLRIAAAVMGPAGDLDTPLALRLVFAPGEPRYALWAAQSDSRYLATALPKLFIDELAAAAQANGLPAELLYAIARRESLFFPAALSGSNALGLFQFIPSTFQGLNEKHDLLGPGESWEDYLLVAENSIHAAALLFEETFERQEKLSARLGVVPPATELFSIMEHNAGYGNVKKWRDSFVPIGKSSDLEYIVDNIGSAQTRIFARHVMSDVILARAAGIFGRECGEG